MRLGETYLLSHDAGFQRSFVDHCLRRDQEQLTPTYFPRPFPLQFRCEARDKGASRRSRAIFSFPFLARRSLP